MAKSVLPYTWQRGFRQSSTGKPWLDEEAAGEVLGEDDYVAAPSRELTTSNSHNHLGINVLRTWPTLYDGTNSPHGLPEWWQPQEEVDVLICGAGPSGLEVALSLVRQGVSFRIIDRAETPLIAGRADGVQPRFLEILNTWGLAEEVHEEGPLIERTAIYKDGQKLLFGRSHQSDSRYRGLHIITQGQIERIYVRDLMRHKVLVERSTTLESYTVNSENSTASHPITAMFRNNNTGAFTQVRAKFLVGSDGAASQIRKSLSIPFDGMSTDIYWGIMDCVFESDYPHAWVFGSVISSEHGGCVIIPREDGYIRLYTQLNVSQTGPLAASRQAKDSTFAEAGGKVDIHSITPEEVLEQANRIFAPYKLKFAAPLSWFAIWKISERVARSFSSPDLRVHLVGDAAHVHSVMGAFGLNASIMDASNLAWKMGLVARNKANLNTLLSTYSLERREHAVRIIEASGEYLRFVCATDLPTANLRGLDPDGVSETLKQFSRNEAKSGSDDIQVNGTKAPSAIEDAQTNGTDDAHGATQPDQRSRDLAFLGSFFGRYGQFLLGVDADFDHSVLTPSQHPPHTASTPRPIKVDHGVRAPNPRVCFSPTSTGYIYDKMKGAAKFHILVFGSSLAPNSNVSQRVAQFATSAFQDKSSWYHRYGGADLFNVVLILKKLPWEWDGMVNTDAMGTNKLFNEQATVVFDDRAPDEDAHTTYGARHSTGGIVVVRPDLWVGMTALPDAVKEITSYFDGFLLDTN